MTTMQEAFAKAGIVPMNCGTDHDVAAAALESQDQATRERALQELMAGGEIAMIDGRYVHACPIPEGYLETMQRVVTLRHQRVTSHVKLVAEETMKAEGYTSAREFSVAQMREAARWINNNDLPLPRVLTDEVTDLEPPPVRELRRKRRYFDPADMDMDPLELLSIDDQRRIVDQARLAVRVLEGTADWDAALQIVPPKMIDSIFLYGSERIIHQLEEQGKAITQKIAELQRDSTSEEITNNQVDQLEARRMALRVQLRHMQLVRKGFLLEREDVVGRAGIDWPKYLSLKERAERSVQAYRQKRSRRKAQLETLRTMPEHEYRKWLRSQSAYKPRHDGVDADPGADTVSPALDE
jgi:hypothetical protein